MQQDDKWIFLIFQQIYDGHSGTILYLKAKYAQADDSIANFLCNNGQETVFQLLCTHPFKDLSYLQSLLNKVTDKRTLRSKELQESILFLFDRIFQDLILYQMNELLTSYKKSYSIIFFETLPLKFHQHIFVFTIQVYIERFSSLCT